MLEATLWKNLATTDPGCCWLWTGFVRPDGYAATGGVYAHRFAYELLVGKIEEGMVLDHLCRVRHCCNPEHLEPVTHRQNILRGDGMAARRARQTHCKRGHEFTEANTKRVPSRPTMRLCRSCIRLARRKAN